jgi:Domain of unknown function (DUF4340)
MKLARSTIINASIAALACASFAAVVATRSTPTTADAEERGQSLLPGFRSEEVQRLELDNGGQKLAIERTPGLDGGSAAFQLVSPVKELADAAAVDKFMTALASAHALRPVDSGPPPSAFELDKPRLRVKVRSESSSYALLIGGAAPAPAGARYVQVSSGNDAPKIVVVDKSAAEDLAVDLDAFRQRSVVPVSEADVTRIAITSPKLAVTLQRASGIGFLIDRMPKLLADRETMSSLFFQLSRLSANRFLSATQAEAALGTNRAHFEVETKATKQVFSFDVGGSCPDDPAQLVVVRRAPDAQSACASRELEATLRLAADDFVDRHPFSLHADEVEELDITGGKSKFALLRKGNAFVLHSNADHDVELEAGNQRITALLEAVGERVTDKKPSELGLDPAPVTVTLRSSAARDADVVEQVVRVGNTDSDGNLLVYREQDGVVLSVPRQQARFFVPDSTLLYARKLTEFGISSFISAEITRPEGTESLGRGANDELALNEPKGFELDGALGSDLIQALGSLTADRFVADRDDGSFGLAKPSLSVRFVSKSDTNPRNEHVLRFGSETALGVYATLDEGGPVFVLQRSVRDTCDTLLINRSVFPTMAEAFNAISIEAHGRSLRLERHGEQLTPAPASSLPQDRVADLLDALGNLHPEVAVHTGPATAAEGMDKPSLTLHLTPKVGPVQTVTFGAGDSWRSTSVFYLRVAGVNATFVMAQSKVRALSDAL